MEFDLSAEQRSLRDAALDLLATHASSERVRAALGTGIDRKLWQAVAEQGWLGIEVAESDGGVGLGFVEAAVLAEAVGRHVAPAPVVPALLAARALPDRRAGLLSGETIAAVGFGDAPVPDAPIADLVLVVSDDGVRELPGGVDAEPAMDQTRSVGWVRGDGTAVGDAALATSMLDRGAVLYAASMLGASERMLEAAVEYAKVREQFGRPIGSFQAVKHRCADMLVDVEGMRSAVWYAAWAVDAGAEDASLAASTAKAWASEAAPRVLAGALQVHGGIGFTWEHDLHLYLKRVQLDATMFGGVELHRDRIATLLRARLAAGVDLL